MTNCDNWLTSLPNTHSSECSCQDCHEWHIEFGVVEENAESPDFRCCKEEMDYRREKYGSQELV